MPISYEKGDADVRRLVQEVMQQHHPCLTFAEVRVDVLMARWWSDTEAVPQPAVKLAGYPCAAVVKVTPLKQRALGQGDALITVDERVWDDLTENEQRALIDHELEHLQVVRLSGGVLYWDDVAEAVLGVPKSDDLGRPRLTCRLHDWQLGGFKSIARRWGADAPEVQAVRACTDPETGQYFWDFAGQPAAAEPPAPAPRPRPSARPEADPLSRCRSPELEVIDREEEEEGDGPPPLQIVVYVPPEELKARQATAQLVAAVVADALTGKEDARLLRQLHDLIPDGEGATLTLGGGTEHECTLDAACKRRIAAVLAEREGGVS